MTQKMLLNEIGAMLGCQGEDLKITVGKQFSNDLIALEAIKVIQSRVRQILLLSPNLLASKTFQEEVKKTGAKIEMVPQNREGLPELEFIREKINKESSLVICDLSDQETGVLFPIQKIAEYTSESNGWIACDFSSAIGKIPIEISGYNVDFGWIHATTINHSEKGTIFFLPKREETNIAHNNNPFLLPDSWFDSPTDTSKFLEETHKELSEIQQNIWTWTSHLSRIRTWFEQQICDHGFAHINGSTRSRLPHISNLCFDNTELAKRAALSPLSNAETFKANEAKAHSSLLSMGLTVDQAMQSVCFCFTKEHTFEEIQDATNKILRSLQELKKQS